MGHGTGPEQVVALQSIDTMNTLVSDTDLRPRLNPLIPEIVDVLCELIKRVQDPTFFEFLRDFVKYFAVALNDKILPLL
jgi:hypothetical protein